MRYEYDDEYRGYENESSYKKDDSFFSKVGNWIQKANEDAFKKACRRDADRFQRTMKEMEREWDLD